MHIRPVQSRSSPLRAPPDASVAAHIVPRHCDLSVTSPRGDVTGAEAARGCGRHVGCLSPQGLDTKADLRASTNEERTESA